jgi:hypothetical protein
MRRSIETCVGFCKGEVCLTLPLRMKCWVGSGF